MDNYFRYKIHENFTRKYRFREIQKTDPEPFKIIELQRGIPTENGTENKN